MRMKREWLILDVLYCVGLLGYILTQLFRNGIVTDVLFLVLLSVATIFLNYRQKKLHSELLFSEEGTVFWRELENGEVQKELVHKMFHNQKSDIGAVIFAFAFSFVMWHFKTWESDIVKKILFTVFLFFANIPTGLAISRLFQYFYYTVQWISNIQFDIGVSSSFATRFVKKMRSNVLLTAVTYCTLSLSSILFTDIEINIVVLLYTGFAVILVLSSLVITDFLLTKRMKETMDTALDRINDIISNKINTVIDSSGSNAESFENFQRLLEVRNYIEEQKRARIDLGKIASNAGLLFITVIPVILQWILDSFKF